MGAGPGRPAAHGRAWSPLARHLGADRAYTRRVSETASARCAEHNQPATGPCERCGTFVCGRCGERHTREGRSLIRCHRCGPPPPERPPGIAVTGLVLSALGMMCPPLSLVGIAIALSLGLWTRPGHHPLRAQYARWSLAVGVMSLVMWALIAWVSRGMVDAVRSVNLDD